MRWRNGRKGGGWMMMMTGADPEAADMQRVQSVRVEEGEEDWAEASERDRGGKALKPKYGAVRGVTRRQHIHRHKKRKKDSPEPSYAAGADCSYTASPRRTCACACTRERVSSPLFK